LIKWRNKKNMVTKLMILIPPKTVHFIGVSDNHKLSTINKLIMPELMRAAQRAI